VKPCWAEFTDAGPGVGVNNIDVKFRSAELDRIYDRDYRIRVHRSRGDSGQNEAERTNSAIGDSVVDGATLEWEHYKRFQEMSEDSIANLTLQDYETYEEKRMEKNAWRVASQLTERIDGAPVLSDYIHASVSERAEDSFFFNGEYLSEYTKKSVNNRSDTPGSAYIRKIFDFTENHVESGELYAEFLKGSCKEKDGSLCKHCCVPNGLGEVAWTGSATERIPRPIPDQSALPDFKYKSVHTSSNSDEHGKNRIPDDWQPRSNIKKLFEQGELSINSSDAITEFSSKFIVEEKLVKNYIEHLSQLQSVSEIRSQERIKEKQARALKDVHCYDWKALVEKGELGTLKVPELDKYIEHNKLSKKGKKIDKIKRITVHYYETSKESTIPSSISVGEDSDESDSDDDLVLCDESESDESDESESDDDSHTVTIPKVTSTRSGRRVGHWSTRYADFIQ